ncbi:MAG: molybdenum cofactor guanylyltransferase [Deltaproteobacteria bacterium]|nr:molybdenum cofactor guanylyltransferase [Deltaproteobacteria bacterium]
MTKNSAQSPAAGPLPLTGIILAGGRSRRLHGSRKPLLRFGDQTIIERIMAILRATCAEILLSSNESEPYRHLEVEVVPDLIPGSGAFGGLYSGLRRARHPYALVVAGDMPFVTEAVIRCLWRQRQDFQVVIPRTPDGLQPLHALYHRSCLPAMAAELAAGHLKISSFFPRVRVRRLAAADFPALAAPHLFFNINTPADLAAARQLFARQQGERTARSGHAGPDARESPGKNHR